MEPRDYLFISSIEWSFLWQAHQEIATRLAAEGNRILYVENTGSRAPKLRDARRVAHRVASFLSSARSRGARQVAPNIWVTSPLVLPPAEGGWRREANRRLFLRQVTASLRELGMRDPIIWSFLPTTTAIDLIRMTRTPRGAVLYHCLADFEELASDPDVVRRHERELVESADLVFANCRMLADRFDAWTGRAEVVPIGVDLSKFPVEGRGAPEALEGLRRPIVGYIGGLHRHVDVTLLVAAARLREQWSWVFVGPVQTDVSHLETLPNVRIIPQQDHSRLADYLRAFDVCTIPYIQSAYTATVVPTKLNEYLAMGKPVVSTALPVVVDFNAAHGVVRTCNNSPVEFVAAIEAALAGRSPEEAARRRAVAALSDWGVLVEKMQSSIQRTIEN